MIPFDIDTQETSPSLGQRSPQTDTELSLLSFTQDLPEKKDAVETLSQKLVLQEFLRSYDEIEILVGESIQGVSSLFDTLSEMYAEEHLSLSSEKKTQLGLQFFHNDTFIEGQRMSSQTKDVEHLLSRISSFHGLSRQHYGHSMKILENIQESLSRDPFSDQKNKKLLLVFIARGFPDGLDSSIISNIQSLRQKSNIEIQFLDVHGFEKEGRIFSLEELLEYFETSPESLRKQDMPHDLGLPIDLEPKSILHPPQKKWKKKKENKPKKEKRPSRDVIDYSKPFFS